MLQPQADAATGSAPGKPGPGPDPLARGQEAPDPRTLVDILDATVTAHPDAPAIDDGEVVLSYAELRAEIDIRATELTAAGVARGDRVGIRLPSGSRHLYVTILAVLYAGAAYVPVDADDPDERAALVFGEAGIRVLVTAAGIEQFDPAPGADPDPAPGDGPDPAPGAGPDSVPPQPDSGPTPGSGPDSTLPVRTTKATGTGTDPAGTPETGVAAAGVAAAGTTAPATAEHPLAPGPGLDDDAWIIFTSGSTGTPKGVAVTHRSAAAFVDAEARLFLRDAPIGPADRVLAGLSVAFDASCEEMWLAWRHGACLVPAPRTLVRTGADLGPWLVRREISVVSTVPTLAATWPPEALEAVRLLIFGGEAVPPELAERVVREGGAGREVWNTYGPTEATVVACAAPLTAEGPVRIGLPLDGWDLAVVDAEGDRVGEGESGELVIGGVGLARYLDPAKDAEKYAPAPRLGWERAYRSGDLVRNEAAGLVFLGRADDQIKLGGRRIELGEIDNALQHLPGVTAAAAAIRTTKAGNKILVGYLTGPGAGYDLRAAREILAGQLPAPLIPRLALVEDMPTRTSGKVDRDALPWPLPRRTGDDAEDGLSETARWVAAQWDAVLGAEVTDPGADFFDLGGGSLAAAQLVTALRERYPGVAVADLYDRPRFGALVAFLEQSAPAAAVERRTVAPTPQRAQLVQVLTTVPLTTLTGLQWFTWLAIVGNVAAWSGSLPWLPRLSWWWALLAFLVFITPVGRMTLCVLGARLLLRGVRPGRYPRGGSVHLRLWAAVRLSEASGAESLSGAPFMATFARALGARVGRGVDLHTLPPVTGMLELGDGACVEPEVDLSGYWLDGDIVHIGAIEIGAGAVVGSRSIVLPGARIGKGAEIAPGSAVAGRVKGGQEWAGSPAVKVGRARHRWPEQTPARARHWIVVFALTSMGLAALPVLALMAGAGWLAWCVRDTATLEQALFGAYAALPPAVLIALAGYAGGTVVLVRLFSIGLTEGYHPVRSRVGWQVWATERLLDGARTFLFPLYASLLTPIWLRLLGAKVGKDVEASTVLLLPKFTTVADGAFLADDTMIASYELGGGWLRIGEAKVGKRAFLGNSGMTAPGRRVPKNGLVAVLSAAPSKAKAGSSWVGSPPVRLRRAAESADLRRTFAPSRGLKVARAFVETCRLIPVVVTFAIGLGVLFALAWLADAFGHPVAALLSGVTLLAAGAVAGASAVAAKWLLVGRIRAGEHPLWSSFVWRNEVSDTFVETVAAPWFARAATGTPVLNLWLRGLGARIGRGVWCESYWLPEADLVTLGDGATVERGCVVQTHLFHDRVMAVDTVVLEPGATLGPHCVALPATRIGAGATVGPASLVMRGDSVPPSTSWWGNPIAPWARSHPEPTAAGAEQAATDQAATRQAATGQGSTGQVAAGQATRAGGR